MSEIEESVIERIRARQLVGMAKYGVSVQHNDLGEISWLRHAQEEALDLAIYLEKLIQLKTTNPTQT